MIIEIENYKSVYHKHILSCFYGYLPEIPSCMLLKHSVIFINQCGQDLSIWRIIQTYYLKNVSMIVWCQISK